MFDRLALQTCFFFSFFINEFTLTFRLVLESATVYLHVRVIPVVFVHQLLSNTSPVHPSFFVTPTLIYINRFSTIISFPRTHLGKG